MCVSVSCVSVYLSVPASATVSVCLCECQCLVLVDHHKGLFQCACHRRIAEECFDSLVVKIVVVASRYGQLTGEESL